MTVLMRARNSGDTKWITWSANTADYEGIHAPEPILLNSAILEIIFGAEASKVNNDSDVTGTYVSDALEYLNTHAGGGETLEQTLVLGNTTGVNWISIADGYGINSSANRGVINILSGDSSEIALNAGNINITGGESSGDPEYLKTIQGGSINITGGESIGIPEEYSTTHGGWVNIAGGNSINNAGGGISIIGGTSANSSVRYFGPYSKPYLKQGGVINIQGGESNVDIGGSVYVTGGITNDTTKQSGSVIITGGSGAPIGGIAGNVSIAGGTGGWGAGGTISIAAGGGSISGGNVSISAGIASSSGSGIGGNVVVYGGASRGTNNGGSITIEAGRADELGTGGSVTIKSGRNNEASWNTGGDGGNILIESGASGGDGNTSGEINITSGNGDYVGPITIKAGNSVDGDGGDINILGGISNNLTEEPSKIGGTITITGGSGNSAHGGNVVLNGGSDSSDYGGNVIINGGIGNVVGGGGDIILSTFNGGIIELNKIEFNDGYFSALNETEIRLYGSDNHFSGFKASTTGTNNIWTLPEDDGPDGYVLTTDGSGNLSWSEVLDGSDEIDGYNLAIDYTPTNYSAPTNGIIGEHIAAIDGALGSSSGGTGTPFTITTVTQGVAVELAMDVTLPAAPSDGDACAVGFLIEAVIARKNGSIESHAISYWASFTFTYSSGAWTCDGGWEIGMPVYGDNSFYPSYSQFNMGYSPSLPEDRTTAPIVFQTNNDQDGLFVIKGTYRQVSRIDF